MCGSEGKLYRAKVEGIEMNVCPDCSKFGDVLGEVKEEVEEVKKEVKHVEIKKEPEIIEMVVGDFAERIRKKRGDMGLDQEKFAKKINQKKSVVHKMENGEFTPSIEIARRLERILGLQLVEEYAEKDKASFQRTKSEEVTVGDLIKIKKRKKIL